MIEDDEAPSPEQSAQMTAGRQTALSAAVAALIEMHPHPELLAAAFDKRTAFLGSVLSSGAALQADNGFRQGFSEEVRALRSLLPSG